MLFWHPLQQKKYIYKPNIVIILKKPNIINEINGWDRIWAIDNSPWKINNWSDITVVKLKQRIKTKTNLNDLK